MTAQDDASLVGDFMAAHVVETVGDFEEVECALEDILTKVRAEEREACAALLGKEVLRLLGCRDREDAEGIARAASLIRATPTGSVTGGNDAPR